MTKRALCVGINDYPIRGMDLKGCVNDAKAWAWVSGREYVTPDDVKALTRPTLRQRIALRPEATLPTTARSLHLLPGGACVIDTPGLRTLRPDIDEATLAASFSDVETLAGQCRFRDCRHGDEPGCAVREGIDPDRLRNFHKLLRETRRDSLTWVERRQQLSAWKSRGKDTRMRMKLKRGDG